MLKILKFLACTAVCFAPASVSFAQESQKKVMVVFDGSGSMWGQINGRPKINIARDTLSSVLEEVTSSMTLGMIAYGHRKKGQCSDIETVVPPGAAQSTIPAMISAANSIKPKGKTPLSDAVRLAANELRYTEYEATVILVTDGIETCNADPCALAKELEQNGINFTAHVVGFGLSREEGRKVACLAENTGGKYIEAGNAEGLRSALQQTMVVQPEPKKVKKVPETRQVQLNIRDTQDGVLLSQRQLDIVPAGSTDLAEDFSINFNTEEYGSAAGTFKTGTYDIIVRRGGKNKKSGYTAKTRFTVEPGQGIQIIELVLGARLNVTAYLSEGEVYDPKNKPRGAVKATAALRMDVYSIDNGTLSEKPVAIGYNGQIDDALPVGIYLIRGTIDRTTTREKLVELVVGRTTQFDFNMGVSKVYVNATEDGFPVKRQTTYLYDKKPTGRTYWRKGYGGRSKGKSNAPFYLPPGTWAINVGNEGGGKKRSQILVTVEKPGQEIRLDVPSGQRLSPEQEALLASPNYKPCLAYVGAGHKGCLVERVDLSALSSSAIGD